MPVGMGYDIHALKKGRKLMLGGIAIPHAKGLSGHSDGDALLHAIVDALLGAAGLGDIGEHFSDKDRRWKGVPSRLFASYAARLVKKRWVIENIDTVIVAEEPKLSAHKAVIRRSVAEAFGVSEKIVNIKAKTHEGLGPIGKGQAIAAYAVASLTKK